MNEYNQSRFGNDQTQKHILIALISFFVAFFGFAIVARTALVDIFYFNHWVHAVLLSFFGLVSFYTVWYFYKAYQKSHDSQLFFLFLALEIFGIFSIFHAVTAPEFFQGSENILESVFDVTEHYGIFFGSVLFLGVVFPPERLKDWLFRYNKMIMVLLSFFSAGFLLLIYLNPRVSIFLESIVNWIIVLSGICFLLLVIFLLEKYGSSKSFFVKYLISSGALLVTTGIVPLFYQEYNILWWYFHLILGLALIIILAGLLGVKKQVDGFEQLFIEAQKNRLLKKLILITLTLSAIPLLVFSYSVFIFFRTGLEEQAVSDLVLLSKTKEQNLLTFFDSIEGRVVDFSTDNFIHNAVQQINDQPQNFNLKSSLGNYLKTNKLILDEKIYGINIIDSKGVIIASTNDVELGKNENDDDYFINAINLDFGQAAIGQPEVSHHFAVNENSMVVSAPIIDKQTGQKLGIVVNYLKTVELDNLLNEQQSQLGLNSGLQGRKNTLDIYLVNRDGLLFTKSTFLDNRGFLSQKVYTEPVKQCLTSRKGSSGQWNNYLNKTVYGASACLIKYGWVMIVEVGSDEVLSPMDNFKQILNFFVTVLILLVVSFAMYFSRKLINPIKELTEVVNKITHGNLNARAKIITNDEISDLADSFNFMTESLLKAKNQTEAIVTTIPEPFFVLDKEGNIVSANKAALDMLGYSLVELTGKSIKDILLSKEERVAEKKVVRYVPEQE